MKTHQYLLLCLLCCNPVRANDPDIPNTINMIDYDSGTEVPAELGFIDPGRGDDPHCLSFGGFAVSFQFANRFRGNLYRIAENGYALREIKMALAFDGAIDLYVSAHRKQLDGTYVQIDINPDSILDYVLLAAAPGLGANTAVYYSTGPIAGGAGVPLPPGDYAIGFSWGSSTVRFGRDSGIVYPQNIALGTILGSVSKELESGEPPLPAVLPTLALFTGAAYDMELCFDPQPCSCPPPPGPCFEAGECNVDTGDCTYAQFPENAACVPDTPDTECSFYTCNTNADCVRNCDANCFPVGGFASQFAFPNRYRGNLYQITTPGLRLREIGMMFENEVPVDFYVSVHRRQLDGTYSEIDINSDPGLDHVIVADPGAGAGYRSTGLLGGGPGISLPVGDYAIGFAWGPVTVTYGRDSGVAYPRNFPLGTILGSVSRELPADEPPIPASLNSLTTFTGGAYGMELCVSICGNNLVDAGEECDGSAAASCTPGACRSDCTCEVVGVPTVSEWGLVVLTLAGLIGGFVLFDRGKKRLGYKAR